MAEVEGGVTEIVDAAEVGAGVLGVEAHATATDVMISGAVVIETSDDVRTATLMMTAGVALRLIVATTSQVVTMTVGAQEVATVAVIVTVDVGAVVEAVLWRGVPQHLLAVQERCRSLTLWTLTALWLTLYRREGHQVLPGQASGPWAMSRRLRALSGWLRT